MDEEARKQRNYQIVGAVGGFIFPIAGAIGAGLFHANGDRDLARTTAIASALGALFYVVLLLGL